MIALLRCKKNGQKNTLECTLPKQIADLRLFISLLPPRPPTTQKSWPRVWIKKNELNALN